MKELTHISLQLPAPTIAGKNGVVIRPGESLRMKLELDQPPYPVRRRLRVVGETDVFWQWRCEQGMPLLYRSISDALNSEHAFGEKYSLYMYGKGETWPRNAYMKVPPAGLPRSLTFAAMVRAKELTVGELVVELGIYRAQNWRHPDDVYDQPDEVVRLDVPAGTYEWQELSTSVTLPEDAVMLLVRVGGTAFDGKVWIGSPRLFPAGGETVIPPLVPDTAVQEWKQFVWLGENLSRLEWPEFAVCVDGKKCFRKTVFNAIVRGADFEVALPPIEPGKHEVEVILLGDYERAMPFVVQRAEILQESARKVEIIGYPEYVLENAPFGVLVEVNDGNGSRLETVRVDAGLARANPSYEITVVGEALTVTPERVVRDGGDDIILSTGDAIYVPQEEDAMRQFLTWYVENRIGNGICFRPVYRWCGTREANPVMWKEMAPLMDGLGLRYHLMVDGRELPGRSANPPDELLAGPNYLGRQAHERDGAYNYWGSPRYPSLYSDIFRRGQQAGGIFMIARPIVREDGKSQVYYDPCYAADMRQASDYFVQNLAAERGGVKRHTGPSALFYQFYQAGYEWLGAEQMYGPEEVILSALRGASKALSVKDYGAHLAMQWSSCPQDTQAHADRYFLSLATCYLQGVNHINLEEGLWRMESEYAAHDRFSQACEIHREAHAKFRKFMETHPRRGTQRVPLAVLKGRNCGWQCFTHRVWSSREEFKFGPPEESFELLHVFYPRSVLDAVYRNPCTDDRPEGWYTGTPYGAVDIVPLAAQGSLKDYLALAFLGWNTFEEEDFAHLLAYVEAGGTLLLGKQHLSTHVVRNQPPALPRISPVLERIFGDMPISGDKVVREVGKGKVIYFPHDAYPCDASIRSAYEYALRDLGGAAAAVEAARGWLRGSEDVNFAAYDWAGGRLRTLYLLDIDWWSGKPAATAQFMLGDARYEVQAPAGSIGVITAGAGLAAMPEGMDADILNLTADRIVVQSDAGARLRLFAPGRKLPEYVEVEEGGVQEIKL